MSKMSPFMENAKYKKIYGEMVVSFWVTPEIKIDFA